MTGHKEIERKFRLLSWTPEALEFLRKPYKLIQQGYFDAEPLLRVRIMHYQGGKSAALEQKIGIEPEKVHNGQAPIIHHEPPQAYFKDVENGERAFDAAKWHLFKIRFHWEEDGMDYAFDVFLGKLRGLAVLEIEFPSEQHVFKVPNGFIEVTNDPRYSNKELAKLEGAHELGKFHEPLPAHLEFTDPKEGLDHCVEKIEGLLYDKKNRPLVIGIAGPSASGKTTLAKTLKDYFGDSASMLSADDYFVGISHMEKNSIVSDDGKLDFDNPHAVDLALLSKHIQELRSGHEIDKPIYSFETGECEGSEPFVSPTKLLIVEGIYTMYPQIEPLLDLSIFVEIDPHGALWRRIVRDVKRTGQTEEEIMEQILTKVHPAYILHILPQKVFADAVLINEMVPSKEMVIEDYRDVQVKATSYISRQRFVEAVRQFGFEFKEMEAHTDDYYYSEHWPTISKRQLVRVRNKKEYAPEKESIILTYKGPQYEDHFSIRTKIAFEISKPVAGLLPTLGYRHLGTIRKNREIFTSPEHGFVFNLDYIFDDNLHEVHPVRLEIQASSKEDIQKAIKLLNKHGIKNIAFTDTSYAETFLHFPVLEREGSMGIW